MTDVNKVISTYTTIMESVKKRLNEKSNLFKSGNPLNKDDPYWHVILAINKARKIWKISECKQVVNLDLSSCNGFAPEREPEGTQYFLYKIKDNDNELNNDYLADAIPVTIKTKQTKENFSYKTHYYLYKENGEKIKNFDENDVLFTDEGYPIVPYPTALSGTAAVSIKPNKIGLENKHDDYLYYGSIVLVARSVGKSSYFTLMHELGHSFGLTDVTQSYLYKIKQEDPNSSTDFFDNNDNKGHKKYTNDYASIQTNLMSWTKPIGVKLRYRPIQIACSGGTKYYKNTIKKGDEEYFTLAISEEGSDNKKLVTADSWGTIERPIKIKDSDGKYNQFGFEPNQWECIRGACYDANFSSTYSERR